MNFCTKTSFVCSFYGILSNTTWSGFIKYKENFPNHSIKWYCDSTRLQKIKWFSKKLNRLRNNCFELYTKTTILSQLNDLAVSDTGTTRYYRSPNAPCEDIEIALCSLPMKTPNGKYQYKWLIHHTDGILEFTLFNFSFTK